MKYKNMTFLPESITYGSITLMRAVPDDATAIWAYGKDNLDYFTKHQNSWWRDEADIRQYFTEIANDENATTAYYIIRDGDTIVGTLNVWNFSRWRMACELGYDIAPQYSGRGYATRAVKLMTGALINANIVRIVIQASTLNTASIKVPQSAGFAQEGTLHNDVFLKSLNCFSDTAVFAIVDENNATKLMQSRQCV